MATRRIQNRPSKVLQTEQKIAFVLLVCLGFGGVIFGFRSFGSHLYRPIQEQMAKYYTGQDVVGAENPDSKLMEDQKKKDTDGDGLSDYDELYVYKTSPYLKDSDSDGIDDKTEVFGGTDPNCPKGKDCSGGSETANTATTSPDTVLGGVPGNEAIIKSGVPALQNKDQVLNMMHSATVQQIRDALLQSGVSKADVDKVSDADLQTMFNQAIAKAAADNQASTSVTGSAAVAAPAISSSTPSTITTPATAPTGTSQTNP